MYDSNKSAGKFTHLMYNMAVNQSLTLEEAIVMLKKEAYVRTVRETLARYAQIPPDAPELSSFLIKALLAHSPGGTNRNSIERKIHMWINGDIRYLSKRSAIQLCFALNICIEEAEEFLYHACGEGFHWRNPEEIVFLYALDKGMNYAEASELYHLMEAKNLFEQSEAKDISIYTESMRNAVKQIENIAELETFLKESRAALGKFHNTAYQLFKGYLDLLISPTSGGAMNADRQMSIREVNATYLYEKFIPRFKRNYREQKEDDTQKIILTAMQKNIYENWPGEASLSKMLHRKTDVSRKTLILLFLATDGDTIDNVIATEKQSIL